MKKKMILTTVFLLIGFTILLPIYIVTGNAVVETISVTVGVTLYHFAMRLAVGNKEIVGATCQSEIIHEVIMALSWLPIAAIPFLGGTAAIIITSFASMMIDSVFVILQRYNRPRLVKVMERFDRLK